MASARPVVVTASGGPQEIVRDGENGLLVPARDAAALAAGIIKVLQNPERARQLGESARKDVVERFSLARMISEYEALYMHCLEGA